MRPIVLTQFSFLSFLTFLLCPLVIGSSLSLCLAEEKTPESIQELTLYDGSKMFGQVIEENGNQVRFRTTSGLWFNINRSEVQSIRSIRARYVNGRVLKPDPNDTRLFFAPTARSLPQGKGYFADYMLFFPFLSYGATNYLTLSGGTGLFFFEGAPRMFYIAPKLRVFHSKSLDVAIGGFSGIVSADGKDSEGGIGYAVGTWTGQTSSLTAGIGYGFSREEKEKYSYLYGEERYSEWSTTDKPIFMVGGDTQLSNHVKLISENWIFPKSEEPLFFSAGVRFFGENLAADLGLITNSSIKGLIPWVDFVYNF